MPDLIARGYRADIVVVDPPRKGCDEELLAAIVKSRPQRIIYVSCNPATLARDLRYLAASGYIPGEVQPVDMFPHTSHVECVTLMSRVKK
jgi:23S rRNA (uracil1939-C5)-methyltransferase